MMNLSYDPNVDAVYIKLSDGKYKKSRKISEAVLVDEDSSGKILGIEILSATKNIKSFKPKEVKLTIQNPSH